MKLQYVFIALLLVIAACQKNEVPKPQPEQGYPTTYNPLSSAEWEARNAEFQQINIYEGLFLNEYGFVEGDINLPYFDTITKAFIENIIFELVSVYKSFMGIPDSGTEGIENLILIADPNVTPGPARIEIDRCFKNIEKAKEDGYYHDYINVDYKFFINQYKIEERYFSGPDIIFYFDVADNSVKIDGNWFPKIYLPQDIIISEGEAIGIAYREILKKTGRNIWESKHNYHSSITLNKCTKRQTI